jgi:hypothetical protein
LLTDLFGTTEVQPCAAPCFLRRETGLAVFFCLSLEVVPELFLEFDVHGFWAEERAESVERIAEHSIFSMTG